MTALLVFGASLAAFSFSRDVRLSLVLLFLSGYGMMVHTAASNTILQTIVDDDKRGRVMSLYAAAFMGTMPLGSLLAGALSSRIGAPKTVLLGGLACLAGALGFARALPALRLQMRPIYVGLGILPEPATGLGGVAETSAPAPSAPDDPQDRPA